MIQIKCYGVKQSVRQIATTHWANWVQGIFNVIFDPINRMIYSISNIKDIFLLRGKHQLQKIYPLPHKPMDGNTLVLKLSNLLN